MFKFGDRAVLYEVVGDTEPYDMSTEIVVGEEFGYSAACPAVDDTVLDGNDMLEILSNVGKEVSIERFDEPQVYYMNGDTLIASHIGGDQNVLQNGSDCDYGHITALGYDFSVSDVHKLEVAGPVGADATSARVTNGEGDSGVQSGEHHVT